MKWEKTFRIEWDGGTVTEVLLESLVRAHARVHCRRDVVTVRELIQQPNAEEEKKMKKGTFEIEWNDTITARMVHGALYQWFRGSCQPMSSLTVKDVTPPAQEDRRCILGVEVQFDLSDLITLNRWASNGWRFIRAEQSGSGTTRFHFEKEE